VKKRMRGDHGDRNGYSGLKGDHFFLAALRRERAEPEKGASQAAVFATEHRSWSGDRRYYDPGKISLRLLVYEERRLGQKESWQPSKNQITSFKPFGTRWRWENKKFYTCKGGNPRASRLAYSRFGQIEQGRRRSGSAAGSIPWAEVIADRMGGGLDFYWEGKKARSSLGETGHLDRRGGEWTRVLTPSSCRRNESEEGAETISNGT